MKKKRPGAGDAFLTSRLPKRFTLLLLLVPIEVAVSQPDWRELSERQPFNTQTATSGFFSFRWFLFSPRVFPCDKTVQCSSTRLHGQPWSQITATRRSQATQAAKENPAGAENARAADVYDKLCPATDVSSCIRYNTQRLNAILRSVDMYLPAGRKKE